MARVIVSHFSGISHKGTYQSACFYDGLIRALAQNGNDVLHIVSSDFLARPWNGDNTLLRGLDRAKLLNAVRLFSPDLVIAFNNSTIGGLETTVECPIALWDADSLAYFNDKDILRSNIDRYHLMSFSDSGAAEYRSAFRAGDTRVKRVRGATAVQAKEKQQDFAISFIGTFFYLHDDLLSLLKQDTKKFRSLVKMVEVENRPVRESVLSLGLDPERVTDGLLRGLRGGESRNQTIAAVAPLGITIFGPSQWSTIASFSIEAALGYDHRLAYSLAHNESIYNRSKIGLSIAHSQNVTGYPWRVYDIMASNACLVSDFRADLHSDFKKNVPLPMYETPLEARDLCKKVLGDDDMRREIVELSQAAIDSSYRWPCRLSEIGEFCGVDLSGHGETGKVFRLDPNDFFKRTPGRVLTREIATLIRKLPPGMKRKVVNINRAAGISRMLPHNLVIAAKGALLERAVELYTEDLGE